MMGVVGTGYLFDGYGPILSALRSWRGLSVECTTTMVLI